MLACFTVLRMCFCEGEKPTRSGSAAKGFNMQTFEGNGIYWRAWQAPPNPRPGQVSLDCSSWVFVKRAGDAKLVYRRIAEHDGKCWLEEHRIVDELRFLSQLDRKANRAESDRIWAKIRAPVGRDRTRQIQDLVTLTAQGF